MQLSPHFQLYEFIRSSTASRYGIDNTLDPSHPPHAEVIANLQALCTEVLEPLRTFVNSSEGKTSSSAEIPIVITSGYRCPQLNKAVGGAANSQHMTGQAADLRIPSLTEGRKWMEWIIDHTSFDQCIMEHCKNKDGSTSHWIHVSYSRKRNRQYVISNMWKG